MTTRLERLILLEIARNGSVSEVEEKGYTSSQIALAMRQMLKNGSLIRKDSKFLISSEVQLPSKVQKNRKDLDILSQWEIEKIDKNDQYEIGHQAFAQIKMRVRP